MKTTESRVPRIKRREPGAPSKTDEIYAAGIRMGIRSAMHTASRTLLDAKQLDAHRILQPALYNELSFQTKLDAKRGLKEPRNLILLEELLEAWENERGKESCDCRPEPENEGHVCIFCSVRTAIGR